MVDLAVIQSLSRATEASPTNPDVWLKFAEALLDHGSVDAARHVLVRARSCEPQRTEQWAKLAELGQRLENQSELPKTREKPPQRATTVPRGHRTDEISFRGDLRHFALPDILEFLATQDATGDLHLRSGARTGVIQMAKGKVVDIFYPQRPSLADLLTSKRRVSSSELSQIPTEALTNDVALRKALLHLRLVDPEILGRVVCERTERGLLELLRWEKGQAEFRVCRKSLETEGMDTRFLVLSALKSLDEQAHAMTRAAPEQSRRTQ